MRHARLEEVAQGAWAVIALPDRGAVGNAGIVDLGGEALVFDTHFAPGAARELRAAAEELAGPVRTVVNSHWHPDHVRGNGSFPEATVLATTRTRELMATRGEERLRELKNGDEGFEEQARAFRERGLVDELEILEEFVRELPGLEQRLPDETWEERLDLGRASLLTWGGGHSDSDAVLWLPEDRTVFAADLVFVGRQPWAGDGDPAHWVQILERLDALGVETVVPGHGPVAGPEAFAQLRDYLEALIQAPASMPERFAGLDGAQMWERNRAALEDRSS